MRNLLRVALAGTIVVLVASVALAQPPFRGGMFRSPAMLLRQESVQKELKLTDDQIKKVEEVGEAMREKFQDLRDLEGEERAKKMRELMTENEKAIAKILKPEQEKRLKQISYQVQGPQAFANPQVAQALGLTDAQKSEIRKIDENLNTERRELFQGGPPDEETRKKMRDLEKNASEKIMKVLTSEQKTKWKAMEGEPFKGEIRFGPR